MSVDEICWNIGILEIERKAREMLMKEYKKIGCDKCNGYNPQCKHYVALYVTKEENGTV